MTAIRITESDLHMIIKESVDRVLNEVKFGGESFHGNNAADWAALDHIRHALSNRDKALLKAKHYKDTFAPMQSIHTNDKEYLHNGNRSFQTAMDNGGYWSDADKEGKKKANRIIDRHIDDVLGKIRN